MSHKFILNLLLALAANVFLSCADPGSKSADAANVSGGASDTAGVVNHHGLSINYRSYGEGVPTLLFIHGWCINQTYWESQVEALKRDYHIVTMDLPGFGQSGKNRDNWTIKSFGEDVQAVINKLNLNQVILIGHSMGGDIMVEAALGNEKVMALVGIDNFKDVGIQPDPETQTAIEEFIKMLSKHFDELVAEYAQSYLFHPSTDSLVRDRVIHDFQECDSTVAIASLSLLLEHGQEGTKQLSQIKQKLYLINSDATSTHREGLDATGVTSQIFDIEATGHYPMIEKPSEFNKMLLEVLQEIEKGRH